MALITTWLQPEVYSAAQDRHLIYAVANGRARVLDGMVVTARAAGDPFWSVNVAEGECVVRASNPALIEASIVANRGGSVNWELDPPPEGQQANVKVGIRLTAGVVSVGELGRVVGPIGHVTPPGVPFGAVVLADVRLVGSSVLPEDVTDKRIVMPLTEKIVSTDAPPSSLMPGGAFLRVE